MAKLEKEEIQIRQTASGNNLSIPVFRMKSENPGPKVYLQSSVHAAEVQGNAVIYELLNYLTKHPDFSGEFVFVPFCNPYGLELRFGEFTYGRFDPSTGENWNRGYFDVHKDLDIPKFVESLSADSDLEIINLKFRKELRKAVDDYTASLKQAGTTYGKGLNAILQSLAVDADIVLDLHCDSCSLPHVYTPAYLESLAKDLPVNYFVSFPNEFSGALDEAVALPWWTLREELRKQRNIPEEALPKMEAYTVELGNMETVSFSTAKEQAQGILEFLAKRNVLKISENISPSDSKNVDATKFVADVSDFQRIYADKAGLIDFSVSLGTKLNAGDPVAKILSFAELNSEKDLAKVIDTIRVPEDCILVTHSASAATHQDANILKVFRNYREL